MWVISETGMEVTLQDDRIVVSIDRIPENDLYTKIYVIGLYGEVREIGIVIIADTPCQGISGIPETQGGITIGENEYCKLQLQAGFVGLFILSLFIGGRRTESGILKFKFFRSFLLFSLLLSVGIIICSEWV